MTLTAAWAGTAAAPPRAVNVCTDQDAIDRPSLGRALPVVEGVFERIGVKIQWRTCGRRNAGGIVISFSDRAPCPAVARAMACTLPYEGVHAWVFPGRVRETFLDQDLPQGLAYVMVHEIAHILQGVARHAERGIMKADWTTAEYAAMAGIRLRFTDADVELIHAGIDAGNGAKAPAESTGPPP